MPEARGPAVLLLAGALAGCAAPAPRPSAPVAYACEDGRQFQVTYHPGGETATIELARMRFGLLREPAENGERYGCGVLTLFTAGALARVDMEGEPAYRGCRALRP